MHIQTHLSEGQLRALLAQPLSQLVDGDAAAAVLVDGLEHLADALDLISGQAAGDHLQGGGGGWLECGGSH